MELLAALRRVPDSRGYQGRDYGLNSLLMLIILGKMCGHQSMAAIHRMGRMLTPFQLKKLGFFKGKAPAHSTLTETMRLIDAEALQKVLSAVVQEGQPVEQVAIDGKTLRGSATEEQRALHCVSAFCVGLSGSIGQVASAGKGLEIPDALRLLASLTLKDVMVTGDAMFCQETICQTIENKKGFYLFPVKDNQPGLREDLELLLDDPAIAKKNTRNLGKKRTDV